MDDASGTSRQQLLTTDIQSGNISTSFRVFGAAMGFNASSVYKYYWYVLLPLSPETSETILCPY